MILELLLFIVTTAIVCFYYTYKKNHKFFKDRDVKYLPGWPLFGNVIGSMIFNKHRVDDLDTVYYAFPDEKYVGFAENINPFILIRDPEIIKNITVRDFDHFTDHRPFLSHELDPLLANCLFLMKGDRWRDMRTTLSPSFTGSKMKYMLPFISEIADNVIEYLNEHLNEDLDVDNLIRRYTNDVIAFAGFGYKINSIKDRDNDFYSIGNGIVDFDFRQRLALLLFSQFPNLAKRCCGRIFPEKLYSFFTNIVASTLEYRRKEKLERPDMIQLLLETKKDWTPEEIIGQVFLFFVAGYETSASALVLTYHELALNPEIQEKLYQECKNFKENKINITFDSLSELKYMEAAINETLRKWSPAVVLNRVCTKPYELPPPREGGKPYKLQPGDFLYNVINTIQMDPKYWPDPHKYEPERFLEENKHKIHPFTYGPFGVGPRACIGTRFAMMELKVLAYLTLVNFKIMKTSKTMDPIKLLTKTINVKAMDGTNLRFVRRQTE